MFFDKYLTMLVNYIVDKDADVRNSSRKTFRCLLSIVLDKSEIE